MHGYDDYRQAFKFTVKLLPSLLNLFELDFPILYVFVAPKNDREAVKKCCVEVVLENFPNTLGLTVFSVTLGIALAKSGIYARPVLAFFQSLAESTVTVTTWVMW